MRDVALICPINEVSYDEVAAQPEIEGDLAEIEDDPLFDPLSDYAEMEAALAWFAATEEPREGEG